MGKAGLKLKNALKSASAKLSELADNIETEEDQIENPKEQDIQEAHIENVVLHLSGDPRVADEKLEEEAAEEERNEERINKRKKLIYLIPVAVILIILLATIPPFINSHKAYNAAEQLLADGKYEEAKAAFAELGEYSDSDTQAKYNVDYSKAINLMKAAKESDGSALELLGLKRTALSDEEVPVILYENAAILFDALEGYKDSAKNSEICRGYVNEYYEGKNREKYNAAVELLENSKYLAAKKEFEELGNYGDSADMVKECIYRRASEMLNYVGSNNVRSIYAGLSNSVEKNSIISMPSASLINLGSDAVLSLKKICGDDNVELKYEDEPSEGLLPICSAIKQEFDSIAGYKDSKEMAKKAEEAGNFTREFFELCESGQLQAALFWLQEYNDEFEGRENYPAIITTFIPYCRSWDLFSGDPTLIPMTIGKEEGCATIKTLVSVGKTSIVLKIYSQDGTEYCEMNYLPDANGFTYSPDEMNLYFATISNTDKFSYSHYYNGINFGAVEYSPAY